MAEHEEQFRAVIACQRRFDLGLGEPLELSSERHQALNAVWFTVVTPEGWRSVKDPIPLLQGAAK